MSTEEKKERKLFGRLLQRDGESDVENPQIGVEDKVKVEEERPKYTVKKRSSVEGLHNMIWYSRVKIKKVSQTKMAHDLMLGQSTISRLENGDTPTLDTYREAIGEYLGIDPKILEEPAPNIPEEYRYRHPYVVKED